jgi:hypothetical protein
MLAILGLPWSCETSKVHFGCDMHSRRNINDGYGSIRVAKRNNNLTVQLMNAHFMK